MLILPSIGVWHLRYEIKQVKREMKYKILQGVSSSETILFSFTKNELAKQEKCTYHIEDREIEVDGRMYDIVSQEEKNGIIKFRAISDKRETLLKKQIRGLLADLFSHNNPLSKEVKRIVDFFKTLYCQSFDDIRLKYYDYFTPAIKIDFQFLYHYLFMKVLYSPPKI